MPTDARFGLIVGVVIVLLVAVVFFRKEGGLSAGTMPASVQASNTNKSDAMRGPFRSIPARSTSQTNVP